MANFKKGDKVEWETWQRKTSGKVVKKLTSAMDIKGHHVAASEENPEGRADKRPNYLLLSALSARRRLRCRRLPRLC